MSQGEAAKAYQESFARLFPDVVEQKSLGKVVCASPTLSGIVEISVDLLATTQIKFQSRMVQIYAVAEAEARKFNCECWAKGVALAYFACGDLPIVQSFVADWLVAKKPLTDLKSKWPDTKLRPGALAFESGSGVAYAWNEYLNDKDPGFVTLVQSAAKQPLLRQLFPFRSFRTLRFSRVTGYPYTWDLPYLDILANGRYVAHGVCPAPMEPGPVLAEGNVDEALAAVINAFPSNVGPAQDGTAENLNDVKLT